MRCWRVSLKRKFSCYLNGELAPREVKQIEDHLLDCGACREKLARMRGGHLFAGQLPRLTPQRDGWRAIEAALEAEDSRPVKDAVASAGRGIVIRPSFAIAAAAIVLVVFGLLVVLIVRSGDNREEGALIAFEALDFHPVSIADIQHNTQPHVVAEGYVSEVRIDHEDGDLVFKLVEDVQKAHPFIICEILNPERLAPPRVGSRVRVYGVSRYDNKEDHNWYEVHPVLNIEVVR